MSELPATMHAITYDHFGSAEVLSNSEIALPAQVNNEVLVKVNSAGINPIDAKTRAGGGASAGISAFPFTPGNDFSGIVVRAPFELSPLQPGTPVFGCTGVPRVNGSYAEYVSVPITQMARRPISLTETEAAAVPCAALTAWGAVVDLAKARTGQRILVHAGAGGVGHFAVQFAHYFGAWVVATASADNAQFLRDLGADEVVDYHAAPFETVIDTVDVVIDLIGNLNAKTSTRSLSILRRGGLIINVPSGSWPTLAEEAQAAHVRATTFKLTPSGAILDVIGRLIDAGDIRVVIDRVFPLQQAAAAHTLLEQGHARGKIVLKVTE